MAKTNSSYLLIPGETEWEIWSVTPNQPTTLHSSHTVSKPSQITNFPSGDLIFFFPVQSLTSIPLLVPTNDESLFADLAATHAERLGLRPDPLAGQLTDIFPISITPEISSLLYVVLRNPNTDHLPTKSPKSFDFSARALPCESDSISIWKELQQWVFAIHQGGKLVYTQTTSSTGPSPDANLVRDIRITIAQLSLQGINLEPNNITVWSNNTTTQTSALSNAFTIPIVNSPRPSPFLPETLSHLLPADVRAARRAARQRQNTIISIAAVAIIYLGMISYSGFGLWKIHSTTQKLIERATTIAPLAESFRVHTEKWDEIESGISREYNTVDILNRVAKCIPANSGLRLKTASISPDEILLIGEAPQSQAITQFSLNLNRSNELAAYEWQTSDPRQSTRGWEFQFTAALPKITP
jgi:hypothetical protein